MMRSLAPLALLLAASSALVGCIAEERVTYVRAAPEAEAAEVVEVAPAADSVYVGAHWEWNGRRYVWVGARYLRRPHPGLFWMEAHWQNTPQGWYWQEGHWIDGHAARPHPPMRPRRPQPAPAPAPQGEAPEGEVQVDPNVPPAPTYAPPPPPANIPPPPGGAVVPQHYIQQPIPNVGY